VDPQAHPTVIRYAYRFLAAMYHPDNSESGDTEKFKTITEAWRVLSDATARQAYDMQLGLKTQAAQPGAAPGAAGSGFTAPKASLSWGEVELRLAVLQVLMEARRKKPQTGGASAKMLMDCLNCNMGDIEYVLWYLREKNYITRTESAFMITIQGVDYLIDSLSKTQPMDSASTKAPVANVNLPATLG
jgi:curved DNA-binding protein CbpA